MTLPLLAATLASLAQIPKHEIQYYHLFNPHTATPTSKKPDTQQQKQQQQNNMAKVEKATIGTVQQRVLEILETFHKYQKIQNAAQDSFMKNLQDSVQEMKEEEIQLNNETECNTFTEDDQKLYKQPTFKITSIIKNGKRTTVMHTQNVKRPQAKWKVENKRKIFIPKIKDSAILDNDKRKAESLSA